MIVIISDSSLLESTLKDNLLLADQEITTSDNLSGRNLSYGDIVVYDKANIPASCDLSQFNAITIGHTTEADISKPFHISKLVNLIHSKLNSTNVIEGKAWKLDITTGELRSLQREIKLTNKEAKLLAILYTKRPKTFTKEELLNLIWHYNLDTDTKTLDTHIHKLRNKVRELGLNLAIKVEQEKYFLIER